MKRKKIVARTLALMLSFSVFMSNAVSANVISTSKNMNNNSQKDSKKSNLVGKSLLQKIKNGEVKNNNSKIQDQIAKCDENKEVTIVVELKDDPLINNINSKAKGFSISDNKQKLKKLEETHKNLKSKVKSLITSSKSKSFQSKALTKNSDDMKFVYDYYVVMNGFSVKTKYKYLDEIKKLDNVKNAFVEQTYKMEEPEKTMDKNLFSSTQMIGASEANKSGYTGKGTVVAVLDSGLDVKHEAFNTYMPKQQKYNKKNIKDFINESDLSAKKAVADKVYINNKIPYVYDYADGDMDVQPGESQSSGEHGTHVSGIVAANCNKLKGVVPDAQLMMMKIFSSNSGTTSDSIVIAALDDAVKLHADSINMSFGSACGFSESSNQATKEIYERVKKSGINLAISAGNAYNSALANKSGKNLPYAEDPDYGIIGSPSTYDAAMSVASMVNKEIKDVPYFIVNNKKIFFSNFYTADNEKLGSLNGTYQYIYCGDGTKDDFEKAGYVKGKVALVSRNNDKFEDKIINAYNAGAAAVLIINNQSGFINISGDQFYIPAGSITKQDGEYLRQQSKRQISFSNSYIGSMTNPNGYRMSDYSSWGPAPDLKLKPEITAPGENIYSSVLNNKYESMSGTSMASPHIAGVFSAVKQYVNKAYRNLSDVEKYNLINSLVMSTASPAKDEKGEYYSPRKQGAGLVNIENAIDSGAYLSSENSDKPKAELGSSENGSFSFNVTVHNISNKDKEYTVDTSSLIESVNESGLFTFKSKNYTGKGINVTYAGTDKSGKIKVKANSTSKVKVNIQLSEDLKNNLKKKCPNGNYVDGFLRLDDEYGVDLTMPFLGYYGDWAKPKVIDKGITDNYHMFGSLVYNSVNNKVDYLGQNMLSRFVTGKTNINTSRYAISPNSLNKYCSVLATQTGLLRNAKDLTYTITNKKTGEVVKSYSYDNVWKSQYYLYGNTALITWAESFMYERPVFDGKNDNGTEVSEGTYNFTVKARADGTSKESADKWSFDFEYDKTPAKLKDYKVYEKDGHTYADLVITDNHYLSGCQIKYDNSNALSPNITFEPDKDSSGKAEVDENGDKIYTVKADLTPLLNSLSESGIDADKLKVDLYDYAMNINTVDFNIKDSKITLKPSEMNLNPGEESQITAIVDKELGTEKDIKWSTSDEAVAKVSDSGLVTAVKDGKAVITAESTKDSKVKAQCIVTVGKPGFNIENGRLVSYTGKDANVTIPDGVTEIANSAFYANSSIVKVTIPASVKKIGNYAFSSCSNLQEVKFTGDGLQSIGSSVFSYTHLNTIDIPKTVSEIGANAFNYCSYLNHVVIPDKVTKIENATFFYCSSLTDLKLPKGLKEIGRSAIYCTSIENLDLPDSLEKIGDYGLGNNNFKQINLPKSCISIGNYAFQGCSQATVFNSDENLQSIGEYAFQSCTKLKTVNINKNVSSIGKCVFNTCTALDTINVNQSNSNYSAENGVLYSKDKTVLYAYALGNLSDSFTMPGTVKKIAESAFESVESLSEITLNDGLEEIGMNAFKNAKGIKSITIPDSVNKIGESAFEKTSGLNTVVIGSGLKVIEASTFRESKDLVNVTIGSNVNKICHQAFYMACSIENISIPDSVETIEYSSFVACDSLKHVKIGRGLKNIDTGAFVYNDNLHDFTVDVGNKTYRSVNGVLFSKDLSSLIQYPCGKENKSYTVPNGVKSIEYNAVTGANNLEKVKLPKGLNKIDNYAFSNCTSLKEVNFPEGLETINDSAFYGTDLREIVMPESLKKINFFAFAGNMNLNYVNVVKSKELDIDMLAFSACNNIKTFIGGNNIKSIGYAAISNNDNLCVYTPKDSVLYNFAKNNGMKVYEYSGFTVVVTPDKSKVNLGDSITFTISTIDEKGKVNYKYVITDKITGKQVYSGRSISDRLKYTPRYAGNFELKLTAFDGKNNKSEAVVPFLVTEKSHNNIDWQYGKYLTKAHLYKIGSIKLLSEDSMLRDVELDVSKDGINAKVGVEGIDKVEYYNGSEFIEAASDKDDNGKVTAVNIPLKDENPNVTVKVYHKDKAAAGLLKIDFKNAKYQKPEQKVYKLADGIYSVKGSFYYTDWPQEMKASEAIKDITVKVKQNSSTVTINVKPWKDDNGKEQNLKSIKVLTKDYKHGFKNIIPNKIDKNKNPSSFTFDIPANVQLTDVVLNYGEGDVNARLNLDFANAVFIRDL